jgi:uncharacterized protein (TIGR02466 family)
MICEQWFSTPIWTGNLNNVEDIDFEAAIQYCLDCKALSPGRTMSNRGGWQSDGLFFNDIKDTPLVTFLDEINIYAEQVFLELDIPNKHELNSELNLWVNVNKKADYNSLHDHPVSSLSGVFYLTQKNSAIVFKRNLGIPEHHLKWLRTNFKTPLSYTTVRYTPTRGDFFIFPSWLKHFVEPSESDEDRISVAFNYGNT